MATPPKKKPKISQKFRAEYSQIYPCIVKSRLGEYHAFCQNCRCDFGISHGGKSDIDKHFNTNKHISATSAQEKSTNIGNYFVQKKDENSVINAEVLFTDFLVEHNLPLSVN